MVFSCVKHSSVSGIKSARVEPILKSKTRWLLKIVSNDKISKRIRTNHGKIAPVVCHTANCTRKGVDNTEFRRGLGSKYKTREMFGNLLE